jgi:phosphohistidine swiveling domain-containing protein
MVSNSVVSGVVFNRDPNTGSQYLIVNWALGTNTTIVTSGKQSRVSTFYLNGPNSYSYSNFIEIIRKSIQELILILGDIPLDVEFAITKVEDDFKFNLLQVRKLKVNDRQIDADSVYKALSRIQDKIDAAPIEHPYLLGDRIIFANMSDWNPAEIIGARPKPLALSLYRELITDSIWAYQRHNYGYRDLRSVPLVWNFEGMPYVDVRASFNSFIPERLESGLSKKIINIYIEKLIKNPDLHDKIEFEIVLSSFYPGVEDDLENDNFKQLSKDEKIKFLNSLVKITNNIVIDKKYWEKDIYRINQLSKRNKQILNARMSIEEKIYWMMEDCKRYGTLPFAGIARAAFIATQFLKKIVKYEISSQSSVDMFLSNIGTITSEMIWDEKNMIKTDFISKYGHLRPGTYDINAIRYDADPEMYFAFRKGEVAPKIDFNFKEHIDSKKLNKILKKNNISFDTQYLINFIEISIKEREKAKFVYSKNISDTLELIKDLGKISNIHAEDLAYLDYQVLKNIPTSSGDLTSSLKKSIDMGKGQYEISQSLVLPPIIKESIEVWGFNWPEISANFITNKVVTSQLSSSIYQNLGGKIILIESADPGFDWIFSKNISGLITCFGGANSHMAIRANELQIPAAIGVGESDFKSFSKKNMVTLDCLNKQIFIHE